MKFNGTQLNNQNQLLNHVIHSTPCKVDQSTLGGAKQKPGNLLDAPGAAQIGKNGRKQCVAEFLIRKRHELERFVPFWEKLARAGDSHCEGRAERVEEGAVLAQALHEGVPAVVDGECGDLHRAGHQEHRAIYKIRFEL